MLSGRGSQLLKSVLVMVKVSAFCFSEAMPVQEL